MIEPGAYELVINAGGALRNEIALNAAMCSKTPERLLSFAPLVMIILARRRAAFADGIIALHRGNSTAAITTEGNLAVFKDRAGMTMHEGVTIGDLGGTPYQDLRVRILTSTAILQEGARLYDTSGHSETCGFLVWSFLRLLNNLREDLPGGTIGVASLSHQDFVPVFGPSSSNPKIWGCHVPSALVEK